MCSRHENFVNRMGHEIGHGHGLHGGAINMLIKKHRPEMLGALNFVLNRGLHSGNNTGPSEVPAPKAKAGNMIAGSMHTGGSMHTAGAMYSGGSMIAGSMHTAGSLAIGSNINENPRLGGSMHTAGGMEPFDISHHKDMYHHLLSLSPAHWELYREKAAQVLGAHPSPMWDHLPNNGSLDYQSAPENYHHILRMPNTHSAARMVEAEATTRGAGFTNALKHIHRLVRPIYPALASTRFPNLNPKHEAQRLMSFIKPIAHSAMNLAKDASMTVNKVANTPIGRVSLNIAKQALLKSLEENVPGSSAYAKTILDEVGKSRPELPAAQNKQPVSNAESLKGNANQVGGAIPGYFEKSVIDYPRNEEKTTSGHKLKINRPIASRDLNPKEPIGKTTGNVHRVQALTAESVRQIHQYINQLKAQGKQITVFLESGNDTKPISESDIVPGFTYLVVYNENPEEQGQGEGQGRP